MYTPDDIRKAAKKINNMQKDLSSSESKFRGELGSLDKWWKGDACKAFISSYNDAVPEINGLYKEIDNLEEGLKKLASKVQQADDEKKRKAADKKKSGQATNNKR
ncbi:MAG: WXG100 family type VII secretion target [Clostridiaceae bacterium]|nr:WXG100 family type VII secretion target [Clostridiaceae bacterium]